MMRQSKLVISIDFRRIFKFVFVFLMIFPHLVIAEYTSYPVLLQVTRIGRVASCLIVVCLYIFGKERRTISPPTIVLIAIEIIIFTITVLNNFSLPKDLTNFFSAVAMFLIIDYFMNDAKYLFDVLFVNYSIIQVLNIISVIEYYPVGKYSWDTYAAGGTNEFICFALPAIMLSLMYICAKKNILGSIALIVISVIPIVMVWSVTSIVSLAMFLIFIIFFRYCKFKKMAWSLIGIDVLISILRVFDRSSLLGGLIVNYLEKDITLNGRTYIWDAVCKMILKKPIFGYGYDISIITGGANPAHAHNEYFQLLLTGGIIVLCLFFLLNYIVGRKITLFRSSKFYPVIISSFAALFTLYIGEAYKRTYLLFIVYLIAYHITDIENGFGVEGDLCRK